MEKEEGSGRERGVERGPSGILWRLLKHLQIFQPSFRLYIENWQMLEASANNLGKRFFHYNISKQWHLEFTLFGIFGAGDRLALWRKCFVLRYSLQQTVSVTLERRKNELFSLLDPLRIQVIEWKIESTVSLAREALGVVHPGESYTMINMKISS